MTVNDSNFKSEGTRFESWGYPMPAKQILGVSIHAIPQFLKECCLWCVWVSEIGTADGRRAGKFPCSDEGHLIRVNQPSEWMNFTRAAQALQGNPGFKGLGVLLQAEHRTVGIDIDNCIDANDNINPAAMEIVHDVTGYWEKSPSGRGLHGYVRGQLPMESARRFAVGGISVEVYDRGRYLTVTGHRLPESTADLIEGQHNIDALIRRHGLIREGPLSRQSNSGDWPPALIGTIVEGCAFMRHVRDNASTLTEPDWYAGLSILGRCQNGEGLAHEWSRPYPNYTPEETGRKLRQAIDRAGPATCDHVATGLGHESLCTGCPNRGRVRSPISLGRPSSSGQTGDPQWPEPQPLDSHLTPVPVLSPDLIPQQLRTYALDMADRMQVPLAFVGATLLVALAGVTGRRFCLIPKELDLDWRVFGNLWGGIVSPPGTMKTPVIKQVTKILHRLERQAFEAFQLTRRQYEQELAVYKAREAQWRVDAKDQTNQGRSPAPFDLTPPVEPTLLRFVVNDATVAKLQQILAENPQGVLLIRDELAGWFAVLDSKGRESERPFFLECWDGEVSFTMDRVGRGTVRAESLCLSLLGGIQPDVFRRYLLGAILGGTDNDGLAQRLQILVYPDPLTTWENVDRPADEDARQAMESVFIRIASVPSDEPIVVRFDPDAQAWFNQWREILEHRLLREPMPAVLHSHLSKYRGLMPKIALLCHLADDSTSLEIPLHQAVRASEWCEFLEAHARRVYEDASPRSMASILAEKIQSGSLGSRFTIREVVKKGWSGLTSGQVVRALLQELEEADWVRKEPVFPNDVGGRPADRYVVNPRVTQSRS